jgi:hypothetical protein
MSLLAVTSLAILQKSREKCFHALRPHYISPARSLQSFAAGDLGVGVKFRVLRVLITNDITNLAPNKTSPCKYPVADTLIPTSKSLWMVGLFNDDFSVTRLYSVDSSRWMMKNLKGFGNKRSCHHFKELSRHSPWGTEENHEEPQSGM